MNFWFSNIRHISLIIRQTGRTFQFCHKRRPPNAPQTFSLLVVFLWPIHKSQLASLNIKRLRLTPCCCELERELMQNRCDCGLPVFPHLDTSESSKPCHFISRNTPNNAVQNFPNCSNVSLRFIEYLSPSAILFIPMLSATKWRIFLATTCDECLERIRYYI